MKKVQYAPAVELSLRSLDPFDERRVRAWFIYLQRWDEDNVVRENSLPVPGHEGIYMLRTSTDVRIFFRIEGDTITVLDVANKWAIFASGGIPIDRPANVAVTSGATKGE